MKPGTLLVLLMVSVPGIVGAALLASFLLVRSGVGLLAGVGIPFLVAMVVVGVLGGLLASAARKQGRDGRPDEKSEGKSGR